MPRLGPRFFDGTRIRLGTVEVDPAGRILTVEEGEDTGRLDHEGIAVPAPVNAHTHVGDHLARRDWSQVEMSLAEAVAPPDGLKHRLLEATDETGLLASLQASLAEADAVGTGALWDFREGGPRGARVAREAAERATVDVHVLGRPTTPSRWEEEAMVLGSLVDGIGVSGLRDQPMDVTEAQAAWCHEQGKTLALHLSEGRREDAQGALLLEPHLLVHCTHATHEDLAAIAEAGIPVVACPRSNELFGNRPPLEAMVESGLDVHLGTDNAMFHPVDIWQEVAFVAAGWPGLPAERILRMLSAPALPGQPAGGPLAAGQRALLIDDAKGLRTALAHQRVSMPWRSTYDPKP